MTERTTRSGLIKACYSFLVPIARLLLRSGISYREFAELTKIAFVEVAMRDYGIRGRPTNISRVTAITGIGRKEVRRVRQLSKQYEADPRVALSPLSDVLHHWYTDRRFLNEHGTPRILSQDGPDSFVDLVRSCAGDVPFGAIRAELLRCGAIEDLAGGHVRALRRYVVPEGAEAKIMNSMAFALRGLASTVAFNTDPKRTGDARIERIVQSDPMDSGAKEQVVPFLRERLIAFTEEIDDLFSRVPTSAEPARRIGVGVFYYEDGE